MTLNLINDSWIPVKCADGSTRTIAPWQMGEPDIVCPNWPRPDLNIACYEFLIGLVYLADPPADYSEWRSRVTPDPDRMKSRLAAFASDFELLGNGPRFMQEHLPFASKDVNAVDMLFIDSAGDKTIQENKDLMVHRGRYDGLDLPTAAMALYALQAQAPSGGAGNRTSLRGGGPMTTLIKTETDLWTMVWANMPYGAPGGSADLPWNNPVQTDKVVPPPGATFNVAAFFGMPRRLFLVGDRNRVAGVVQKPWGNNYISGAWEHPLSPYYRMKSGGEWLPKHPKAGSFGYREWLGIITERNGATAKAAWTVQEWTQRGHADATVLVAGWAMDNMKPLDYIMSIQPVIDLPPTQEGWLNDMILAANTARSALYVSLATVLKTGVELDAELDEFFRATEASLLSHITTLKNGGDPRQAWLDDLKGQATKRFSSRCLEGLSSRDIDTVKSILAAKTNLDWSFRGYGKIGGKMFQHLGMPVPQKAKASKSAAKPAKKQKGATP